MKYELMLIIKPLLPEEIKSNILKNIEGLIKKFEGNVVGQDIWGKRHLAYPINKHEEGYYAIYKIEMSPKVVSAFDKQLQLDNNVLRFLRIKEDK